VTGIEVRQLRGRSLRGIGHVVPWLLRSAHHPTGDTTATLDDDADYGADRDDDAGRG